LVIEAGWSDASADEAHVQWVACVASALEQFTTGAAYINDLGRGTDEGPAEIAAAFGTNYDRLARIKARYDPSNFFSHNQNIAPSGEPASGV
jgi:FAD/FMN-containing dehydrogenase